MVLDIPPPLTVSVADRWVDDELLEAVTVIVPLEESEDGEMVSHDSEPELLLTFQLTFDVTVTGFDSPEWIKLKEDGETSKLGAFCVTLIVCGITPGRLLSTVMVADRSDDDVLVAAVTVIVPLFVPDDGDTVSHEALLLTDQLILDEIVNDFG